MRETTMISMAKVHKALAAAELARNEFATTKKIQGGMGLASGGYEAKQNKRTGAVEITWFVESFSHRADAVERYAAKMAAIRDALVIAGYAAEIVHDQWGWRVIAR
jgi:hypothetical protein